MHDEHTHNENQIIPSDLTSDNSASLLARKWTHRYNNSQKQQAVSTQQPKYV